MQACVKTLNSFSVCFREDPTSFSPVSPAALISWAAQVRNNIFTPNHLFSVCSTHHYILLISCPRSQWQRSQEVQRWHKKSWTAIQGHPYPQASWWHYRDRGDQPWSTLWRRDQSADAQSQEPGALLSPAFTLSRVVHVMKYSFPVF